MAGPKQSKRRIRKMAGNEQVGATGAAPVTPAPATPPEVKQAQTDANQAVEAFLAAYSSKFRDIKSISGGVVEFKDGSKADFNSGVTEDILRNQLGISVNQELFNVIANGMQTKEERGEGAADASINLDELNEFQNNVLQFMQLSKLPINAKNLTDVMKMYNTSSFKRLTSEDVQNITGMQGSIKDMWSKSTATDNNGKANEVGIAAGLSGNTGSAIMDSISKSITGKGLNELTPEEIPDVLDAFAFWRWAQDNISPEEANRLYGIETSEQKEVPAQNVSASDQSDATAPALEATPPVKTDAPEADNSARLFTVGGMAVTKNMFDMMKTDLNNSTGKIIGDKAFKDLSAEQQSQVVLSQLSMLSAIKELYPNEDPRNIDKDAAKREAVAKKAEDLMGQIKFENNAEAKAVQQSIFPEDTSAKLFTIGKTTITKNMFDLFKGEISKVTEKIVDGKTFNELSAQDQNQILMGQFCNELAMQQLKIKPEEAAADPAKKQQVINKANEIMAQIKFENNPEANAIKSSMTAERPVPKKIDSKDPAGVSTVTEAPKPAETPAAPAVAPAAPVVAPTAAAAPAPAPETAAAAPAAPEKTAADSILESL